MLPLAAMKRRNRLRNRVHQISTQSNKDKNASNRTTDMLEEIKEKLSLARPSSLGQAARVSGVTPTAVTLLMVKLHSSNNG